MSRGLRGARGAAAAGSPEGGAIVEREREEYRPPWLAAGLATLAVFALYALTLARTTQFWDTSEYIATAHILGIPHPPGNPLFVVLARAWELLLEPTGLSVAVRINLFSATMSALAHGFWFLVMHRVAAFMTPSRGVRLVAAAAAVVVSATAFTVWNQSNVNEKVYTVSLFTIALLSWLAFRWRDNLGRGKDDNLILLMVFVLALSVGNHLMAFLAAPALALFILMVAPRTLLNWRLHAAALAFAALALSIHLFLPLRAQLEPIIDEGDPACASPAEAVASIGTWGRSGCAALSSSLTREQYRKPPLTTSPVLYPVEQTPRTAKLFASQVANYAQYFDWQWARSVAGRDTLFGGARPLFTLAFLALGIYGALRHRRRDRLSWTYMAALFATLSVGLVFYLNFKYGFSMPVPEALEGLRDVREVRERDYFFIVGFSVWGLWAGLGVVALWQRVAGALSARLAAAGDGAGAEAGAGALRRARLVAAPVLALALIPLALNWTWASRAHDYAARDWAYNLLMSVEPYGVLFTNGDNDTFPLWYLQEVEGIRQDVTVIVMSYLNTPWYVKQLRQLTAPCEEGVSAAQDPTRILCQRPFVPEQGAGVYEVVEAGAADRPGQPALRLAPGRRPPTGSIIQLSDQQIEQIATAPFVVGNPLRFEAAGLRTVIEPGTLMEPSDTFVAAILTSSLGDRPIHFVVPAQAAQKLGLYPHMVRKGLALQLQAAPVEPDPRRGLLALPDSPSTAVLGRYIDLPRTERLIDDVFVQHGGLPDAWKVWPDFATLNVVANYAWTHYAAAQAHALQGNQRQAAAHVERAEAWLALAQR